MMEKLVRDRIPEIMKRNGVDPQVREANQGERLRLLLAKLHEEASELECKPCVEECADVFEVVLATVVELGSGPDALYAAAEQKVAERGAFQRGYVLNIEREAQ